MATRPVPYLTPEEYLELERRAERKHEYLDGQMYELWAMSEASPNHALIVANVVVALGSQLRGRPCKLYTNDLRLRCPAGLHAYPDVVVACGEHAFADEKRDTLLNPTVIVEVLSPSTQDYDRGTKWENYRAIASLREYVLVARDRPHIAWYVRQDDGRWLFSECSDPAGVVQLESIGCQLALAEVFEKADLAG